MKIALVHNAKFPVAQYGGTERLVWWLAKGLKELGHQVVLVAAKGSVCPYAKVQEGDFTSTTRTPVAGVDIEHHFASPPHIPNAPYLLTIGGNGKNGEVFFPNTVFVSKNMADRHGADAYVLNAVDPADYVFSIKKKRQLVFLAKASWRVKNVRGAIRVSRRARIPLQIIGGSRWWLPRWRGVHWRGMLGGDEKSALLAESSGLIFPVVWHEPFGIAVVESLISGTPVLATPFGSLPEIVSKEVGILCSSYKDFEEAVLRLESFSPKVCREYALANFHYHRMTKDYLILYERVLAGEAINSNSPRAINDEGRILPFQ